MKTAETILVVLLATAALLGCDLAPVPPAVPAGGGTATAAPYVPQAPHARITPATSPQRLTALELEALLERAIAADETTTNTPSTAVNGGKESP